MCGLVGIITSKHEQKYEDLFTQGLVLDTIRGKHSTGVAVVQGGDCETHKLPVPGIDFIDSKSYKDILQFTALHRPVAMMGHNRAATLGKVNKVNSHPFDVGPIVGMHNGTLRRYTKLEGYGEFGTDSETLFDHLSRNSLNNTLNNTEGAYCLVWWEAESNSVNIIRNSERPLFMATLKGKDTVVYGSELEMIMWLCSRNGYEVENVYEPAENTLYTFDLASKEVSKPRVKKLNVVSAYPPVNNQGQNRFNGSPANNNKTYHQQINDIMEKYGLKRGDTIRMVAIEYEPYTTNPGGKGKIVGFMSQSPFSPVVIHGMTKEDYESMDSVEVVTLKTFAQLQGEEVATCELNQNKIDPNKEITKVTTEGVAQTKLSDVTILKGPDDKDFSVRELDGLVKGGCGICGDSITREEYPYLEWHHEGTPICPGCINEWLENFANGG